MATSYYIETPHEEPKSSSSVVGFVIIGGLIVAVVIAALYLSHRNSTSMHHNYGPHVVHVSPPEIASASAPVDNPFFSPAPYAIAPNNTCIAGSRNWPTCLSQVPVEWWTSGDPYCTQGSNYWPICRDTQSHPLPAYRF